MTDLVPTVAEPAWPWESLRAAGFRRLGRTEILLHHGRLFIGGNQAGLTLYNPGMSFLRFLMLLSLVIWLGGVIFLAFVEAPTAFSPGLLPTRHMAGSIVGRSLDVLHSMAMISGIVFLIASMTYNWMTAGIARPLAVRHLLIALMLLLTAISQFAISPRMHAIRAEAGVIDNLPPDSGLRVEFSRLHVWSEKVEEGVLLLGLVAIYATASALK
jgi:uncharacterized membrane protein